MANSFIVIQSIGHRLVFDFSFDTAMENRIELFKNDIPDRILERNNLIPGSTVPFDTGINTTNENISWKIKGACHESSNSAWLDNDGKELPGASNERKFGFDDTGGGGPKDNDFNDGICTVKFFLENGAVAQPSSVYSG